MAGKTTKKDDSVLVSLTGGTARGPADPQHESVRTGAVTVSSLARQLSDREGGGRLPSSHVAQGGVDDYYTRTLSVMRDIKAFQGIEDHLGDEWPSLAKLLRSVITEVVSRWSESEGIPFIPTHGPEHNFRMVVVLFDQFHDVLLGLKPFELRLLLASIWLHDVGMTLPGNETEYADKLELFPDRSADYINAHYRQLGLTRDEQRVVSNLCRFHARYQDLLTLEIMSDGLGLAVDRQKVLLALLRLAELLEIRSARVAGKQLAFVANLPTTVPINLEVYNSFLRNLFIGNIHKDAFTLRATIGYRKDWRPEEIDTLLALLRSDLEAALDKIKDVFLVGENAAPVLVSVRVEEAPDDSEDLDDEKAEARVILATTRYPNAGQVIGSILDSLEVASKAKDAQAVTRFVTNDLGSFLKLRPGHVQISNLSEDLSAILNQEITDSEKLIRVEQCVRRYRQLRSDAHRRIAEIARERFTDKCCFMVLGFSECVLQALQGLPAKIRAESEVIVLESRVKTVYGNGSHVDYNDGLASAVSIERLGFRRVCFAPDAAAATVYSTSGVMSPTHVLLGIDAIDREGSCYNTVGTLSVALIAQYHGTPVYVLAEGKKIRRNLTQINAERRNRWLTNDPLMLERIANKNIAVLNPALEKVPAQLITGIITEKGLLQPGELVRYYPELVETGAHDSRVADA